MKRQKKIVLHVVHLQKELHIRLVNIDALAVADGQDDWLWPLNAALSTTLPRVNDGRMEELKNIMNMNKNFEKILNTAHPATQDTVRRFLDSENTEVVLSAKSESSVYTNVGDSSASDDMDKEETLVEGALEIITEDGNDNCPECGCGFVAKYDDGKRICLYCPNEWTI